MEGEKKAQALGADNTLRTKEGHRWRAPKTPKERQEKKSQEKKCSTVMSGRTRCGTLRIERRGPRGPKKDGEPKGGCKAGVR